MSTFTLDVSSPVPSGYTGPLGGPGQGDHQGSRWYIAAGNDLGAPAGTPVVAAFAGRVSTVDPTGVGVTDGPVYGVGLFVRARGPGLDPAAGNGVGGFYTHFELEPGIGVGSELARGQRIGQVVASRGIPTHVHFAIAVRTNEVYTGANVYAQLQAMSNTSDVQSLTLSDGARGGSLGGFEEEQPEPLVIPEG